MIEIDPKLLEILVCPVTKSALVYDREKQELVCRLAGLAYPIRDGVPNMLAGEARELTEQERLHSDCAVAGRTAARQVENLSQRRFRFR